MHKTTVKKDFKEKSILVSREFNAPLETVWKAFTEKNSLLFVHYTKISNLL